MGAVGWIPRTPGAGRAGYSPLDQAVGSRQHPLWVHQDPAAQVGAASLQRGHVRARVGDDLPAPDDLGLKGTACRGGGQRTRLGYMLPQHLPRLSLPSSEAQDPKQMCHPNEVLNVPRGGRPSSLPPPSCSPHVASQTPSPGPSQAPLGPTAQASPQPEESFKTHIRAEAGGSRL